MRVHKFYVWVVAHGIVAGFQLGFYTSTNNVVHNHI